VQLRQLAFNFAERNQLHKNFDRSARACRLLFHKILEKLMASRLSKFITANPLLNDYQFGLKRLFITANPLLNDYQFGLKRHHSTSLAVI